MKRQRNYFQLKKQEKSPQRINDEAEITSVLDKWVQKSGNENANKIDKPSSSLYKKKNGLKSTTLEMKRRSFCGHNRIQRIVRGCLKVYQFCLFFSNNQLSVSLIFAIFFVISISLISAQIFMNSLNSCHLLTLCFAFFFLSLIALGVRISCLFKIFFSCFLRWEYIAANFPLRIVFAASHRFGS